MANLPTLVEDEEFASGSRLAKGMAVFGGRYEVDGLGRGIVAIITDSLFPALGKGIVAFLARRNRCKHGK